MITITKKEYAELIEDAALLACLRAGGVDNWDGWNDAIALRDAEYGDEMKLAEDMRKAA